MRTLLCIVLSSAMTTGAPVAPQDDPLALALKGAPGGLSVVQTVQSGQQQTIRFAQSHRGVPVLGAHYLVHLDANGAKEVGGRYFDALTVDTDPAFDAQTAGRLAQRGLDPQTRSTVKVTTHGLTVLPTGSGVLTWHLTMRGVDSETRATFLRETYVDAHHGNVALAYDKLNFAGPVSTTGATEHGGVVPIEANQREDGRYELRDSSRGSQILTYDAEGRNYWEYLGELPPETPLSSADTIPFGGTVSALGAVDAHYGAGQVYDFYRNRLGRNGLDGKGGTMMSVVNVTNYGRPFVNAFWDGQKMVYGGSSATRYSFAADVDVIGHEMTHGVITNSADLVYLNQSGAMNEALADYFGNAIDVTVSGMSMSNPDASLIGEDLCKTVTPRQCALRDLNDGRTTYADYLGVRTPTDNGGVHLNSTIFSGALWDIREKLDPLVADRLVYKALTEYMTPLDGFTDGRNAVVSAAKAMRLSVNQQATVRAAFDGHGITAGWERRLGVDSHTLVADVRHMQASVAAADGSYVVTQTADAEPFVLTGDTSGGRSRQLSPSDGRSHDMADTDGRNAVWTGYGFDAAGNFLIDIYQRGLRGGPTTSLVSAVDDDLSSPQISGKRLAWVRFSYSDFESDIWSRSPDGALTNHTPDTGVQGSWLSLNGDILGYVEIRQDATGWHYNPVVVNLRTGQRTVIPTEAGVDTFVKDMTVTENAVYWVEDQKFDAIAAIKRAKLDGTAVTEIVSEASGLAKYPALSANERFVTFSSREGTQLNNASLPKIYQVAVGGVPARFSCNRGDQGIFDADEGRRVVWLDGTTGYTNLVTRSGPFGTCS